MDWACFFCDTDHEVSTVTRGTRLTLTYDVYLDKGSREDEKERVEEETGRRVDALASRELGGLLARLDGRKRYAYHPAQEYTIGCTGSWEEECVEESLECVLKGMDLRVYRALKKNGWCAKLLVMYPEVDMYGPEIDFDVDKYADDEVCMEKAIRDDDKKRLRRVNELVEVNSAQQKQMVVYEYKYYYGSTGNEAIEDKGMYYARTVLVFSRRAITLEEVRRAKRKRMNCVLCNRSSHREPKTCSALAESGGGAQHRHKATLNTESTTGVGLTGERSRGSV
eukprot:jgi/Antlo1/1106/1112